MVVNLAVFYAATQYMLVNLITPLFPDGDVPGIYSAANVLGLCDHQCDTLPAGILGVLPYRAQLSGRDRSAEHSSGTERDRLRFGDIRRAGGIH